MRITIPLLILSLTASAQYTPPSGGGVPTSPASPVNSVQYNNAGAFGGMAGTEWDNTTRLLITRSTTSTDPILIFSNDPVGDASAAFNSGALFYLNYNGVVPADDVGASGKRGAFIEFDSVTGGNTTIATTGLGGRGGGLFGHAGNGGTCPNAATACTGGLALNIAWSGGTGGSANGAANLGINIGGKGSTIVSIAGNGGTAANGTSNTGGDGGSINHLLGSGGIGSTANGLDGTFIISAGARANAPIQQWKNNGGTVLASLGATGALTLDADIALPQLFKKTTQAATAPGAGYCTMRWEAGTGAGTGKLVAYCGTSATGVTIVDNVGAGF